MSEYFLKLPGDSQPRAYSEYEVREFLGQGVIDSKTLTWKQGMEGWQPVAQVLPPMSPVWEETQDQEGKDQPEEQQYRLRYPLNGLAKLSILACFVLCPSCSGAAGLFFPTMSSIMKKFRHSSSRIWFTCHLLQYHWSSSSASCSFHPCLFS